MRDSREGMTPEKARGIILLHRNPQASMRPELSVSVEKYAMAAGFLAGIEYERRTAKNLRAEYERLQNDNVRLRGVVERLRNYVSIWANFSNGEPEAKKILAETADVMEVKP